MVRLSVRNYKYRLYPTVPQRNRLTQMLRDHCELYNAALQERREAWAHPSKTSIGYYDQSSQLPAIRAARPDIAVWSATSQQQTLRRLNKAFDGFFRRVKAGQAPGFPRFKPHTRFDSVGFRHGDGIRLKPRTPGHAHLYIKGVGHVDVRMHRDLPDGARLGELTVKREGRGRAAKWYVTMPVEVEDRTLPVTGREVGIDKGVAVFFGTSDGRLEPNPRFRRSIEAQLAAAQRALATKKRSSRAHKACAARVARLHAKTARQRLDHAHKTANWLVANHDFIAHEALIIANMVKAPAPKPDPDCSGDFLPNGAASKAGLNRSILDTGWGVFTRILLAKAESAGRIVVPVNPAYTSQKCSNEKCGHVDKGNRVTQEQFKCQRCGLELHADINAAINILRAGTALRHAALAA